MEKTLNDNKIETIKNETELSQVIGKSLEFFDDVVVRE